LIYIVRCLANITFKRGEGMKERQRCDRERGTDTQHTTDCDNTTQIQTDVTERERERERERT
jgi:hypothetical protein